MEFIIQAPPGLEIHVRDTRAPRVRAEFEAKVANCSDSPEKPRLVARATQVTILGSNVAQLEALFQPLASYVQISDCGVYTQVQFSPHDEDEDTTIIEGSVSEIRWSIDFTELQGFHGSLDFDAFSFFAGMTEQVYEFDTHFNSASWIRTTNDGSVLPTANPCSFCTSYFPNLSPGITSRSGQLSHESPLTNHPCGTLGDTSGCCKFSSEQGQCGVISENSFLYPCSDCGPPLQPPTEAPTVVDSATMPTSPEAASGAEISTFSAVCVGFVIGAANAVLLWNGLTA